MTKQLFAIAYNKAGRINGKRIMVPGGIEHTHANDIVEAKLSFLATNKNVEIVAIGPALGFFVENDGKTIHT
jgi:hypothetical protein